VSGPALDPAPRRGARPDAIVIGAGIAGLVAATELAQRGHAVLVLEHDHQAGGLMAGMRRRGFHFDVGCQSFEDMGILFPLLEDYGLSDLATFRRARYRLVMPGLDATVESIPQIRAEFQRAFPESANALGRVFDLHERTSGLVRRLFAPGRFPGVRDGGALSLPRWALAALAPSATGRGSLLGHLRDLRTLLLEDFGRWYERELPPSPVRDLLSRCGYSRMNVFVASAFWHLWAHDYWYPEGGLQSFFRRWVEALEARGVCFLFKRTVVALDRRGRRVDAVITHRGERFAAPEVLYTGDWRQALALVGRERFPPRRVERFERAAHSDALVSVYLGLDLPPEALREQLKTSHVFYFPSAACRTALGDDEGAHRRAFLEVTAHSMFDPSLAPPGQSALVLQAFTRHDWRGGWGTGLAGDPGREGRSPVRTAEYRRLKRRVAEDLLAVLEGLVPGVGRRVVFVDVGAPPSTVRFTRNAFGGSCGYSLAWRDFPFASPLGNVSTPLENLHAAGHFTVWPGTVPTAALSGRIAARRAAERLWGRRGARAATAGTPLDHAAAQPRRGTA
jgi:phytoene dehydrogenase-like protein